MTLADTDPFAWDETLEPSVDLVPEQGEDESDLTGDTSDFSAAVSSTDWTVETLVSQMRKGRIDLDPSFQRRNAWLDNRKSKLIESIMLGFPIPQIVLAEKPDAKGNFFVLDGKQRLLALRQFFVDRDDHRDDQFNPLKLSGLEVLTELNQLSLADLEAQHPDVVPTIENHSIRTVVLGSWSSERMLLSLFLRLNTGSVPLSPQELRQALIHGEFIKWLDEASGNSTAIRRLLNNSHPDRRMVDAELLLRHLAFSLSPLRYRGNLKEFLDQTSRYFNTQWDTVRQPLTDELEALDEAITFGLNLFGDGQFARKWSQPAQGAPKFERALNRAVLDVQAFSFAVPEVRAAAQEHGEAILDGYKQLCLTNASFVRAISATTKTAEAFTTRHRAWRDLIMSTTGTSYELPTPLTKE